MEEFISKFNNPSEQKINYNEEQLKFINSPLEDSILLGIPGGGKTQCIIGKIVYHFTNKDFDKNNNYLLLTFSRRACHDFIEKGSKQNKKYFNTKNVLTLHSLAGKIVYKILEKKSSSQDTVIISATELLDKNINEISEMNEFKKLKVIFVDEAQDISFIQYELINKLGRLINCPVIMVGDPNQNIYQFQNGSDQYLINHSKNIYNLIRNYRSTPEIVDFINNFRPWEILTPKMISLKNYNRKLPKIFVGNINQIIINIIDSIKNSDFKRENIAIIGPVKKSKPINDTYSNIGLSLFTNILNDHNINYIKHYEDTNNEEIVLDKFKKIEGHINLLTVHGSKGLEFDQVFLLNFHFNTFGIVPNEEKYNEFKYLWYVGISRAAYDMNIYIDYHKYAWYELKNCPKKYYKLRNNELKLMHKLNFKDEIKPMYYTVTEILGSKKIFDDIHLFNFEKIIKYEVVEENLFDDFNQKEEILNYKEFNALYGIFIENIFNYYYNIKFNKLADYIIKLDKILKNTIVVPKNLLGGYKILKIKCPFITKDLIKLSDFSLIKRTFKKREQELYSYLLQILDNDHEKEFFLDCYNEVSNYSKDNLIYSIEYLKKFKNDIDKTNNHIFQISLYFYQRSNETAYLWKKNFELEIDSLEPYINNTIKYAQEVNEDLEFHPIFKHTKLPLVGELDIVTDTKIIDIKMTYQLNKKQIMQLILYYHLRCPDLDTHYELELWNFHNGKKYKIILDYNKFYNYELLKLLSIILKHKLENMIFFYDLETTGLINNNNYDIDIIDRHFEEYTTSSVPSTGLVRPIYNKIIPYDIIELTGITNEIINKSGDHFVEFYEEIEDIFNFCNNPIFVAHNGNCFDHKILINKEIIKPYKCRLLDSRIILRLFLDKEIANKSLSKIFEYLFNFIPVAHRANCDVKMLISIFKKLNINSEKIINIFQ